MIGKFFSSFFKKFQNVAKLHELGIHYTILFLYVFETSVIKSLRKHCQAVSKCESFFFFFFWSYLQHAEVSRPGIEPAPQLWQYQILNLLYHQGTHRCESFPIGFARLWQAVSTGPFNSGSVAFSFF